MDKLVKKERTTMTVAELFASMPDRFNVTEAAGITKTLQWNITGDEAGVDAAVARFVELLRG